MHCNFYSEFKFDIFFGAITVLSHCCWNIAAGKSTCVSVSEKLSDRQFDGHYDGLYNGQRTHQRTVRPRKRRIKIIFVYLRIAQYCRLARVRGRLKNGIVECSTFSSDLRSWYGRNASIELSANSLVHTARYQIDYDYDTELGRAAVNGGSPCEAARKRHRVVMTHADPGRCTQLHERHLAYEHRCGGAQSAAINVAITQDIATAMAVILTIWKKTVHCNSRRASSIIARCRTGFDERHCMI